jgi:UDP-glucose 4-epimerase
MKSLVIGGAGFIGSHLVDALVTRGPVTIFDNLSAGRMAFIEPHLTSGAATLVRADALDLAALERVAPGHDVLFHFAANPEARRGLENTRLDLEQGTIATYNALEAARRSKIPRFVLASSGTVYGETRERTSEGDLGELPISLYGASKFASEALVSAFAHCFGLNAWIYRFGNVVGPRGTHGAAYDFINKLKNGATELEVLGDGSQSKPYLFVTDCVSGVLHGIDHAPIEPKACLHVFNLAPEDETPVRYIAELCVEASGRPNIAIRYKGGERGWPGDVANSKMSSAKIRSIGFALSRSSDQAVGDAIAALAREIFARE